MCAFTLARVLGGCTSFSLFGAASQVDWAASWREVLANTAGGSRKHGLLVVADCPQCGPPAISVKVAFDRLVCVRLVHFCVSSNFMLRRLPQWVRPNRLSFTQPADITAIGPPPISLDSSPVYRPCSRGGRCRKVSILHSDRSWFSIGETFLGTIAYCWWHWEVARCTSLPHGRFNGTTF